jgi:hypothetical protein
MPRSPEEVFLGSFLIYRALTFVSSWDRIVWHVLWSHPVVLKTTTGGGSADAGELQH